MFLISAIIIEMNTVYKENTLSSEFKVIPQYIIMKEGECMELNNRTTSFFIFILSGEITISFEQYTNRSVLENEMFFLPKNNCFKWWRCIL